MIDRNCDVLPLRLDDYVSIFKYDIRVAFILHKSNECKLSLFYGYHYLNFCALGLAWTSYKISMASLLDGPQHPSSPGHVLCCHCCSCRQGYGWVRQRAHELRHPPPLPPPATGCCHHCIHAPPVPPLLSIALQGPEEIDQGVNCWDQECWWSAQTVQKTDKNCGLLVI